MSIVNHTELIYLVDHVIDTWTPLTNSNTTGDGAGYTGSGQRAIQVTGTFGAGGTCIVEGTLDNTNWFQLNDLGGTAISFTAAGLKGIREDVLAVRPRVTGGDGTTSLTAVMTVRRNFRM